MPVHRSLPMWARSRIPETTPLSTIFLKLEPPGRTIPVGNAYPSPGLPSEAPATPGTMPKNGSFLKGMHMGIWLRLGF